MELLKKFNGSLTPALKNISMMVSLIAVFIFIVLSYDSKVETSDLNYVNVKVDSLAAKVNEVIIRDEYRDKTIDEIKIELIKLNSKTDELLIYIPRKLTKKREKIGE